MKKKSVTFELFLKYKIHFERQLFELWYELAKLGKASQEAYNLEGWLIL